jgi:hypothetical protein
VSGPVLPLRCDGPATLDRREVGQMTIVLLPSPLRLPVEARAAPAR